MLESPQVASPAAAQQRKPTAPTHMRCALTPCGHHGLRSMTADRHGSTGLAARILNVLTPYQANSHRIHLPVTHCMCSSPSGTVPIGGGAEVLVADGRGGGDTDSQRTTAPPSEAGSLQEEDEQPDVRVPG